MVHFKPDNIEWLKMQTRKRLLQEWKKCFKTRLFFRLFIVPMKLRKTFKKDLHVPILFTLQTIWCYSGQRKIWIFPSKNLKFFFPFRVRSLLLSKTVYQWEDRSKKQILLKEKRNCSKFQSKVKKIEKYICLLVFNPQMEFRFMVIKQTQFLT